MKNPTYDEAIHIIKAKRKRAKEVINIIIERYSVISNRPVPGIEILLDYFVNMVYGLELLLKVLARDWDIPNKSKYGHKVGKMYEAIFGRPHTNTDFMKELEDAILDQKFIFEPANCLIKRVEIIESLWDELKDEYLRIAWEHKEKTGDHLISHVEKTVKTDAAFGNYLLSNVARFTTPSTSTSTSTYAHNPMTTEQSIQMRRMQIEQLQQEITRLETEEEPVPPTVNELCTQLSEQFRAEVERRQNMMQWNLRMQNTLEMEFMFCIYTMAASDLG